MSALRSSQRVYYPPTALSEEHVPDGRFTNSNFIVFLLASLRRFPLQLFAQIQQKPSKDVEKKKKIPTIPQTFFFLV